MSIQVLASERGLAIRHFDGPLYAEVRVPAPKRPLRLTPSVLGPIFPERRYELRSAWTINGQQVGWYEERRDV